MAWQMGGLAVAGSAVSCHVMSCQFDLAVMVYLIDEMSRLGSDRELHAVVSKCNNIH